MFQFPLVRRSTYDAVVAERNDYLFKLYIKDAIAYVDKAKKKELPKSTKKKLDALAKKVKANRK